MRRVRGFGAFLDRYRWDLLVWALVAIVAASGAVLAAVTATWWIAVLATAAATAIRLSLEIGRREHVAQLEQGVRMRARLAVGGAAEGLVLERTLWHDERATQQLRERLIAQRLGRDNPNVIPYVPSASWSIEDAVARGEDAFDVRAYVSGDWLGVEAELGRAHDAFASAVGPYVADLDAQTRRLVSECLFWLEAGKKDAARAFHVPYAPGTASEEEIDEVSRALYADFAGVHAAASELAVTAPHPA